MLGAPDTLPRPEKGDVWILRFILHDWSDSDSAHILSAIRAAIGANICHALHRGGVLPVLT